MAKHNVNELDLAFSTVLVLRTLWELRIMYINYMQQQQDVLFKA